MEVAEKEQILGTIRTLIEGTEFQGHVFLVGGAVRDELMGLPVKDLDICVDIPDGGIKLALFITHQQRTYRKGSSPQLFPAYGIARFTLKGLEHLPLECVQTRQERYENRDSRNPVTVFAPLREDCLRRDLTINALYKNLSTGQVVDITGWGLDDLKNKVIRTPRQPFITFDEDALRELRCIRFATRFGWEIEPDTLQGIKDNAYRMAIITQDRITEELSRMLTGANPDQALQLIQETGLMPYVLPEWLPLVNTPVWEETQHMVQLVEPNLPLRLSALCMGLTELGKTDVMTVLQRFNYPKQIVRQVQTLLSHRKDLCGVENLSDAQLRALQYSWSVHATDILSLIQASDTVHARRSLIPEIRVRNQQMAETGTACFQVHLPVNGKDIMDALDLPPGPAVKQYMQQALECYFEHPGISKEELLANLIKNKR